MMLTAYIYITRPRSTDGSESDCKSRCQEFDPAWFYTFVEIDHKIFPTVISFLSPI